MVLISTNTFWTIWLFVHLILAVGLIGALTHQAMSVALPVRQPARGIVTRFRGVPAAGYATAVCLLWVLTFIVGSLIYTKYRTYIRIPLEAAHFYKSGGFFDFKEHVASIGLMLLPAYWYFWKKCQQPGIRQRPKGRNARARHHGLVSVHRRPRSQQRPGIRIMMSATTTTTSRPKPLTSSLAASRKFGAFATSFSISSPVVYCLTQYLNYRLFTFHPATNRIVWGYEAARSGEGPNMLWYGWTATAILVAATLGVIAMMLPERITRRIPLALVWILPILAIPYIVYSLMPWWIAAAR